MTRSRRSTWNFTTITVYSVVSMVVGLVTVPVLLRNLGEVRLGAARAVLDWTGYLGIFELGLGGALAPLLARGLARGDFADVRAMLAAGFRGYLRVTAAMLAGGVLLAAAITQLLRIDGIYHTDLRTAMLVALLPLLLMPLTPLRALAEAGQRGYAVNLFLIVQNLAATGAAVFLSRQGWGITGQSMALLIGAVAYSSLLAADGWAQSRQLFPTHPLRSTPAAHGELWSLSSSTLVLNVCGRVGLLTDNIIIGWALGAGWIVPFFMTQRLAQLAQGQLQAVGTATWAGLAELHANGAHESFRSGLLELSRLVVMVGLVGLLPVVAYNNVFIALWVGEAQFGGLMLTTLACANALILSLASLWGWAFGGTGQIQRLVPLGIASTCLNIAVSVGVTSWYARHDPHRAMWGPLLGTTTAYLALNLPCLPLLLRKHFGIPVGKLAASVCVPLLAAVPYEIGLMWIAARHPPSSWPMLAAHMLAAATVFAMICWTAFLTRADRGRWVTRVRQAARVRAV